MLYLGGALFEKWGLRQSFLVRRGELLGGCLIKVAMGVTMNNKIKIAGQGQTGLVLSPLLPGRTMLDLHLEPEDLFPSPLPPPPPPPPPRHDQIYRKPNTLTLIMQESQRSGTSTSSIPFFYNNYVLFLTYESHACLFL